MTDKKLEKFIQNQVSDTEKQEVLSWINSSPDNMKYYVGLRKLWDISLINTPTKYDEKELEESYNELLEKIESKDDTTKNKQLRFQLFLLKIGSIAAVLVLLLVSSYYFFQSSADTNYTTVRSADNSKTHLILPDGTSVWLNANSELKYPNKFGDKDRLVTLDGEAVFEVTSNAEKPFVVSTELHDIKVVGTVFNVYAYKNSNFFETSLIEGVVHVTSKEATSKVQVMDPGQLLIFDKSNSTTLIREIEFITVSWTNGIFAFNDMPLFEILDKISQYKGVDIVYKNNELKNIKYTGKFKEDTSIELILTVMKTDGLLNYEIINDVIYVK